METLVVTGSSGLIGSALCRRLRDQYRIYALDRPGAPHPPERTIEVAADLTDDAAIDAALAHIRRDGQVRIASTVHLAAYYSFSGEESPLYQRLTVEGTRRLLRAMHRFELEQFVFSSTMLVHAPGEPGERIREDSPVRGTWAYPESKVQAEAVIREERGRVPAVALRIAGVYSDYGDSIPIAHQIARIDKGELTSRVYPTSTAHGQAFVHLDDLVDAIVLTVQKRQELPPEVAILIGEDRTLSYDELQHTIGRLLHGESFETFRVPKALAKIGAAAQDLLPGVEPFIKPWMIERAGDHYELDITRARTLLGWRPRHSLRDTLPEIIRNLKADREAWYRHHGLEP